MPSSPYFNQVLHFLYMNNSNDFNIIDNFFKNLRFLSSHKIQQDVFTCTQKRLQMTKNMNGLNVNRTVACQRF